MGKSKMGEPLTTDEETSEEEQMESSENEGEAIQQNATDSDVVDEEVEDSDVADEEAEEDIATDDEGSDVDEDDSDADDDMSDLEDEHLAAEDENAPEEEATEEKSGWADAMAKVLRTQKDVEDAGKLLLSKAKKDYERKSKNVQEGEVAESTEDGKNVDKVRMSAKLRLKRKEMDSISRIKPTVLDRNREKFYSKLATKGVVQLFNAVRDHQKNIKTKLGEVGKSTRKREEVFKTLDKEEFLNVLSGGKKVVNRAKNFEPKKIEPKVKDEDDKETWSVLRDDFMMGAKMKDWDKEGDSD